MTTLPILDIVYRLFLAMVIGFVVGIQRERNARPAGVRTHMLVSLGACVVMLISLQLYQQVYLLYGSTPDPARMGAQVISGVGFLGAGTIIKDGFSVRGLTTAASLWAVACLGLAAGLGYYRIALIACSLTFITLSMFDKIHDAVRYGKGNELELELECSNTSDVLVHINNIIREENLQINDLSFSLSERNTYLIDLQLKFPEKGFETLRSEFLQKIAAAPDVIAVANRNSE